MSDSSPISILEGISPSGVEFSQSPFGADSFPGSTGVFASASLPLGPTAFYLFGPESGQKVVLIHGITIPALIYRPVAVHLAGKGFRVLAYDLYGRGLSAAPQVNHTADVYVRQLADLVAHVGWESFYLLGSSMGGAIATLFTVKYPAKVSKLILNAPAGLLEGLPYAASFAALPYVGEFLLVTIGTTILIGNVRRSLKNPDDPIGQEFLAAVGYQSVHSPAFPYSYLSCLRYFPLCGLEEDYKRLGALSPSIPVLALWGNADTVVPYSLSAKLLDFIPGAQLHTIEGGGHNSLQERLGESLSVITEFFSSK